MSAFTLGDLLAQEDLGLRLMTREDGVGERTVVGAHTIDLPHPAGWVDRDWLVLTTGVSLQADPAAAETTVRELAGAGVAALGFGLKPIFDEVPDRLVQTARELDLPVVAVPEGTPFREIVERVFRANISPDVRASLRLTSIQRFLMEALGEERPHQAAVERLAALIDGQAVLLRAQGTVQAASGEVPVAELWEEILPRPTSALRIDARDRGWIAAPVMQGGALIHWLVVSLPAHASSALVQTAVHAAVPVLTAIERLETVRRGQDRALRTATLDRVTNGDVDGVLEAQVRQLGLDPLGRITLAVLRPSPTTTSLKLLESVEDVLARAGLPFLAGERGTVVLVALGGGVAEAVEALASARTLRPVVAIGIGDPATGLRQAQRSLRQAELACEDVQAADGASVIRQFGELQSARMILAEIPLEPIQVHAARLFESLGRSPGSLETLRCFFEHRMSVKGTAEVMQLHPNSLRYRLARIEEAVGGSIREPGIIAALYLALQSLPPA